VSTKFDVQNANLNLDSTFTQPEFGLFRDNTSLIQQLYSRLQQYGLTLPNLRIERGGGSIGDFHLSCYLPSLTMTVQVRAEKVNIACADVPQPNLDPVSAAIVSSLSAVQAHIPTLRYATHTLVVGMHGRLEGITAKAFLSKMTSNVPNGLGEMIGNGAVLYFGAHEDRILSTVTFDLSAVVLGGEGLFFRVYVMWDASRVAIPDLQSRARQFLVRSLSAFGLEAPTLTS
jgi:hypothetical protein